MDRKSIITVHIFNGENGIDLLQPILWQAFGEDVSHLAAGGRAVIVGELVFLQDPIGFGVSKIGVGPMLACAGLEGIRLSGVECVDDAGDLHGFIEPKCALWIELSWTHAIQNVQLTGGFDDALFAGTIPLALFGFWNLMITKGLLNNVRRN